MPSSRTARLVEMLDDVAGLDRPVLAVDFDDTICRYDGTPVPHALESLRRMAGKYDLVLWTCREGPDKDEAVRWLQSHGVWHLFSGVNVNPREMDSRKIRADYYIDDKAVGAPLRKDGTLDWKRLRL